MVSQVLLQMGFAPKLGGYSYLIDAIPLYAQDPSQAITKELYVAVGQLHGKAGLFHGIGAILRSQIEFIPGKPPVILPNGANLTEAFFRVKHFTQIAVDLLKLHKIASFFCIVVRFFSLVNPAFGA
jgi:hypothetical protein